MSSSFTLCSDAKQVEASLDTLKNAAFLIMDCEGRELGRRSGALPLLTIGTFQFSQVYVYDAVRLDESSLAPLFRLLASPDIIKVVWDGRKDFSEFYHSYGVTLRNVLDLQIVEVVSRRRRGEGEQNRLSQLKSYFSAFAVDRFPSQYDGLQVVAGMQRCLKEQRLALGDGKDFQVSRMHAQNQSNMWMERPLSTVLVNYAAKDIHLIHLIYDHFQS